MNYTPAMGLSLESREQHLAKIYTYMKDHQLYSESYESFLGSNWHRFLSHSVLPLLEDQQARFVEVQASIFSFWRDHHMAVQGGMGSSYEGFIHRFRDYCTSLHLVTMHDDPRLTSAGQISIYFDHLQLQPDDPLLIDLFRKSMPIAIFTPLGDHQVEVSFSGANSQTYRYFNLEPNDYTPLDLRIYPRYKAGTASYANTQIIQSVHEQFQASNRIGRGFYPNSYLDHQQFPAIDHYRIESSLADEIAFSDQVRVAKLGQKFILRTIDVIQKDEPYASH
ncbi:hypothetical protein PVA45_07765 (plasmid) [Entomospira entomophila]|uniref:Uncharacterized protein n=1 Tax=Entomospira entomophila TaxID=2719988 RepID=A0A968KX18_9SPIO|nr:hypothetical protein [Entomospira entomophilus]NIZ41400.1 hypothetical protein [Entomospira entomophilus]WDI36350.1 hypothetical protein PVA45_07765 [Entomospira entomophilus]